MTLSDELVSNRIEAICIGPHVTDERLDAFVDRCLSSAGYLAGIAVNLHQIEQIAGRLKQSGIAVTGEIASPLGNIPTEAKLVQLRDAIAGGATQVDIVMQVESLREEKYDCARKEVETLVAAANDQLDTIAFIPNLGYLSDEQKTTAARIISDVGAALKTDTGVNLTTSVADVSALRESFGDALPIHAGNCSTAEDAIALVRAGADRVASDDPFAIFQGIAALFEFQGKEI